jgi:hypothetical protein
MQGSSSMRLTAALLSLFAASYSKGCGVLSFSPLAIPIPSHSSMGTISRTGSPFANSERDSTLSRTRLWVKKSIDHGRNLGGEPSLPNHVPSVRQRVRNTLRKWYQRLDHVLVHEKIHTVVQSSGVISRITSLHNPITYMILALLAGLKYEWCFRNPYYWFGFAFCVKWYRARYVYKIPVWDRQPNWNNIITSPSQEKDLKAFTCKTCGSTIFIAKSREFFFEGATGFGGLGCFSCGAKGRDNFVMDRERIVEDVADIDDYFEYERPLDFVTRAERRKLLKEAQGDEDKANLLLLERTTGISSTPETDASRPSPTSTATESVVDAEVIDDATHAEERLESSSVDASTPATSPPTENPSSPSKDIDDLDFLDMDDF